MKLQNKTNKKGSQINESQIVLFSVELFYIFNRINLSNQAFNTILQLARLKIQKEIGIQFHLIQNF